MNFKDLLLGVFNVKLEREISWHLMPLGVNVPIDPVAYISRKTTTPGKAGAAVRQFITELSRATKEIEDAAQDTGRLLTIFQVNLQSTKKIQTADVIAGVGLPAGAEGPLLIEKAVDPNITHPLKQKDVIDKVAKLCQQAR